jgi:hypothetical protein
VPHQGRLLVDDSVWVDLPDRLPQVAEAVRHSRVVATFGRGAERVEIRKIHGSPV